MLSSAQLVLIICLLALLIVVAVLAFLFTQLNAVLEKRSHIAVLIIVASLSLQLIVMPFRGYASMEISSVVGFTVYLITTQFFLKKYQNLFKTYQIAGLVLTGLMVLQLPVRLFDFKGSLVSFPDMLMSALGIFAGVCFYYRQRFLYKVNLSLSVLILCFTFFYGYSLWAHNLDFGNFTGDIYARGPEAITLVSNTADAPIKVEKGRITVMDFWFVGCGQCFKEFPAFQKTYDRFKDNPQIQFYSVNKPTAFDKGADMFKILLEQGYNFPMTVCKDPSLFKKMNIIAYPTLVILNKKGDIIYKGNIEGAEMKLKSLL